MIIDDAEIILVYGWVILQLDPIVDCTKVITQVHEARGLDAREHDFAG